VRVRCCPFSTIHIPCLRFQLSFVLTVTPTLYSCSPFHHLATANPILPRRKSSEVGPYPTSHAPPHQLSSSSARATLFSRFLLPLHVTCVHRQVSRWNERRHPPRAHDFLNYLLNKIVEEIQSDSHHRHQDSGQRTRNVSFRHTESPADLPGLLGDIGMILSAQWDHRSNY